MGRFNHARPYNQYHYLWQIAVTSMINSSSGDIPSCGVMTLKYGYLFIVNIYLQLQCRE